MSHRKQQNTAKRTNKQQRQEAKNVADAFDQTREICDDLKLSRTIVTYTAFMNSLTR